MILRDAAFDYFRLEKHAHAAAAGHLCPASVPVTTAALAEVPMRALLLGLPPFNAMISRDDRASFQRETWRMRISRCEREYDGWRDLMPISDAAPRSRKWAAGAAYRGRQNTPEI